MKLPPSFFHNLLFPEHVEILAKTTCQLPKMNDHQALAIQCHQKLDGHHGFKMAASMAVMTQHYFLYIPLTGKD